MEYLLGVGFIPYLIISLVASALMLGKYFSSRAHFKFTPRGLRVYLPYSIVLLALVMVFSLLLVDIYRLISLTLLLLFSEIILFMVNGIIAPFERARNFRYAYKNTAPIRQKHVIRIVITGSFGKTTCKNILTALLSEKYKVFGSEKNYNTPLGLAKSVGNIPPAGFSESEKPLIFIAEAGARRMGDVTKMCSLVTPTYGIITGVCAQHLDTFKTLERVKRAKEELSNYVGEKGTVIFNGDNEHTLEMSRNFKGKGVVVGTKMGGITIRNLKTTIQGTSFELHTREGVLPLKTALLGRHNALNVSLAVALALELGVEREVIIRVVEGLSPVEHRLEIRRNGNLTILDDSYNANEVGVMEALEVLSTFLGRKVIFAQGVVECGRKKREINEKIGRKVGETADVVLLAGENIPHLKRGLQEVGYLGKIYEFTSVMHAKGEFKNILRQGDILYIQNDVP